MGNPGDSDIPIQGAMTLEFRYFKIKRSPHSGVGNRGDCDTKGANEDGNFDKINFQMSETPEFARKGRGEGGW